MAKGLRLLVSIFICLLIVVGVQAASAPAAVPAGWEVINGAKYPTKELQRASYTNIRVVGNSLYGKPRIIAQDVKQASKPAPKYNSKEDQAILKAALKFVKENLINDDSHVAIVITDKYNGLYFLEITLGEGATARKVKSAITANQKFFLPQVMDMVEVDKNNQAAKAKANATAQPEATKTVKSDKPVVEVFVMSYCPYGTQIEKGLLPVIKTLGNKADIQIKFVSYTMHGVKEYDENLLQYCLNKEQTSKFLPYLECFLKEANSAGCLTASGIDTAKLTACIAVTTNEYKLVNTGTDFPIQKTENTKYGVGGSPTLVINGAEVNSGRSPKALLAAICSAFNTPPAECSATLDNATPSAGFGTAATNATAPASCGS